MSKSCFNVYSELFKEVQHQKIFIDSKTFADAVPRKEPEEIDQLYKTQKDTPGFDLKQFVYENFKLPESVGGDILRKSDGSFIPIEEYVWNSWTILTRANIIKDVCDTEIQIPSPYIVPGGRFRELFYWDSYFTALGLVIHHRYDLVFALANNFKFLVDEFGYIPNGTRTYFIGRSQPPMYSLLINLICQHIKEDYWQDHVPQIERQYRWWMQGEEGLKEGEARLHIVKQKGYILNRYYQHVEEPRPEAFRQEEDFLVGIDEDAKKKIYPELRAGAESGWDFSGRWFHNPNNIQTIHTTDFLPVDLNSLLYITERNLAKWHSMAKNDDKAHEFSIRANNRNKAIRELMYDENQKFFCDYDFRAQKRSDYLTLAGLFPVFAGIATTHEADAIFARVEKEFLQPGGLLTTLHYTHEQWDAPNGWAPLQYITFEACKRYGAFDLADKIRKNFCTAVEQIYNQTGSILEKYNVTDINAKPQDGEYEVQTGFGWTNGVYTWFIRT